MLQLEVKVSSREGGHVGTFMHANFGTSDRGPSEKRTTSEVAPISHSDNAFIATSEARRGQPLDLQGTKGHPQLIPF